LTHHDIPRVPKIRTVAELIAALQAMPEDAPVAIKDADTDWEMAIEYLGISSRTGVVCIAGTH